MRALELAEQLIAYRTEYTQIRALKRASSTRLLEALTLQIRILEALL